MTLLDDLKEKYGEKEVKKIIEIATESSNSIEGIHVSVKGVIQDAEDYYKN